jgi:hypothetical protein
MLFDSYHETQDLKNQIKDLRSRLSAIQALYDMFLTGVLKDEKELVQELKKYLKKSD